jgi:uncharacterized protein YdeI (YjbR/CyaY-like superfamily)
MKKQKISDGAVHKLPKDMNTIIQANTSLYEIWEDITPLARNEWICWIEDAKKQETRERRIKIMIDKFSQGKRRPCCWAGCTHR